MRFETADPAVAWLNRILAIGDGARENRAVRIEVYEVLVVRLDRPDRTPHESSMAKASKKPARSAFAPKLPDSLTAKRKGDIAILRLTRPQKRNALDDGTILGIEAFFQALPKDIKAVVIHGQGEHFSAGLDLSELTERNVAEARHAFAHVAPRVRPDPVRQGAGGRGAARRGGRRRA